jgi:hypothetical protein
MAKNWTIKRVEPGVHRVEFGGVNYPQLWAFLSSDWHWDNPKARLDLIERDLRQAKKVGGCVISAGDFFCAMQGKYDKRSSKDDLRPEHAGGSYLDRLVDTAAEFLKPYVDVMGLMTLGNHETAIYSHYETCLLTRLVERLRLLGSDGKVGGYNGWVQFMGRSKSGVASAQWRLYYHHGSGGDSPVTQGLLGMNRVSQYVDADGILSGHIHARNLSTVCRERLSPNGQRRVGETALIRTSTYKDEYAPLNGFHIEKGRGPRPVMRPGYWLSLKLDRTKTFLETSFHDVPPGVSDDAGSSDDDDDARAGSVRTRSRNSKQRSKASGGRKARPKGNRTAAGR